MSKTLKAELKSGPQKFVRRMRAVTIAVTVVCLPVFFLSVIFAREAENIAGRVVWGVISALAALLAIAIYSYYQLSVSMGTVIGVRATDKVVYLVTTRKTFTYDVGMGCVDLKKKGNRYIGTFETQDSRDKFVFYLHAPFSKYTDGQFTAEDIRPFYPRVDLVRGD